MAEATRLLLADSDLRSSMGKSGRAHAKRDFCHEEIVKQYIQLYEHTIDPGS
jgi:hypothetical protein